VQVFGGAVRGTGAALWSGFTGAFGKEGPWRQGADWRVCGGGIYWATHLARKLVRAEESKKESFAVRAWHSPTVVGQFDHRGRCGEGSFSSSHRQDPSRGGLRFMQPEYSVCG